MDLKTLTEEIEITKETKVLNKLLIETVKSLVEKEYELKLDENVTACANLVKGSDEKTLINALSKLSSEKDTGGKYSIALQKAGTSLMSCMDDIKSTLANSNRKPCDVTMNDPEVKKNFVKFIASKIKDQSFDKEMMNILNAWKLNKIPNIKDAINLLATKFSRLLSI